MDMSTISNISLPFLIFFILTPFINGRDTITPTQPLKDNGQKIISSNGLFELGFFNVSIKRYLGIKYHNFAEDTIIWVANRNTPLNDTSGILRINSQNGSLHLTTISSNTPIWSTNISSSIIPKNPFARLLNTGNLVVSNSDPDPGSSDYIWESFDYPGNTLMPTMKLGWNFVTGLDRYMNSWKTDEDPSEGQYIYKFDPSGYPQIFLTRKGNGIVYRSGPWNGKRFSGAPNLKPNDLYTFEFFMDENEVYYQYNLTDYNVISRMLLRTNGNIERWIWNKKANNWILYLITQLDSCEKFNLCGPYGICNINNNPLCGCLDGFEPKDPIAWDTAYWNDGCVRRVKLECKSDGFKRISGLKLPDTRKVFYNKSLSLKECEKLCYENCSCSAYTNSDVTNGGSGCFMWFGQLIDTRYYNSDDGQDLYVRMAASQLGSHSTTKKLVSILVPVLILTCGAFFVFLWLKKKGKWNGFLKTTKQEISSSHTQDGDLPLFDFEEIYKATSNFSWRNKLGQGGFGFVYKGILSDGQEIAVKRLSKDSNQGVREFKNEASCIIKLQHRNLVKLLGCCTYEDENLLIYEYMPNMSLDMFIFDRTKSSQIDWPKRFDIINGIARGLLYLHHDSRLRIIHRDLKTSNILLDQDFNPKISDFGMARIFGGNEFDQENTKRIVGTYGYMAPEYAIDGHFSTKSDVFSFGVLVLEIICGRKNKDFTHPNHSLNLLGHAWRLYNEERSMDLLDPSVKESANEYEVKRAIHMGLLCVQKSSDKRPNMSFVVMMLGSTIPLADPNEPGFFIDRDINHPSSSSSMLNDKSINEISITFMDGR
ncbi:unnamed protein product [Amaranthus hypochondriacus]